MGLSGYCISNNIKCHQLAKPLCVTIKKACAIMAIKNHKLKMAIEHLTLLNVLNAELCSTYM